MSFDFFGPNIIFSILFSNTLNLCPYHNVRNQVSQPYKTAAKITVVHILKQADSSKYILKLMFTCGSEYHET
jgi:hypothetical protein